VDKIKQQTKIFEPGKLEKEIINWNKFDIDSPEGVEFIKTENTKLINRIIQKINCHKILDQLLYLNWTWYDNKTPTLFGVKEAVKELLSDLVKSGEHTVTSTGGITICKFKFDDKYTYEIFVGNSQRINV